MRTFFTSLSAAIVIAPLFVISTVSADGYYSSYSQPTYATTQTRSIVRPTYSYPSLPVTNYVPQTSYRQTYSAPVVRQVVERPVYVDRVVERPVYVDRVVERPVVIEKPVYIDRVVTKVVQQPVYVQPAPVYNYSYSSGYKRYTNNNYGNDYVYPNYRNSYNYNSNYSNNSDPWAYLEGRTNLNSNYRY